MGIRHALATQRLCADGPAMLHDFAQRIDREHTDAIRKLVVLRRDRPAFADVIEERLRRITFGNDGYPVAIPLPGFDQAQVVADARRGFGQPTFTHGGARLEDVLGLFDAGESVATVALEFGLTGLEVEDAIRNRRKAERGGTALVPPREHVV